jgi:hypothetical protein
MCIIIKLHVYSFEMYPQNMTCKKCYKIAKKLVLHVTIDVTWYRIHYYYKEIFIYGNDITRRDLYNNLVYMFYGPSMNVLS